MSPEAPYPIQLSLDTARVLALVKQGLHQRPPATDKQTLLDTVRKIDLLQLDTISVVARSHYLVMLSRVGLYPPEDLDALLYPDRCLFEQWAHAACLIPVESYAYLQPVILSRRKDQVGDFSWAEKRLGKDPQATLDAILAEVHERGPLASRDFEDPRKQRGSWWDWKPAKTALEILFHRGYLAVDRREGFQRYYDLAERVLPVVPARGRTVDDYRRWATLRSTSCLGVATANQISDYYRQKVPATRATVRALVAGGTLLPVEIEGWKDQAYLLPSDLPLLEEIQAGTHQPELTTFLSPFDNLIWDRQRVEDLFDFHYRVEMYTPAAKRQYGYYVVPILHRGRLVGRLDPKANRKAQVLIVRAIYLEPGQAITDELLAGLAGALREFMAFHDSHTLRIERSKPEELAPLLLARLDRVD
jgi:uncharacterized protein YcaQ